jgi:hypothetical protein
MGSATNLQGLGSRALWRLWHLHHDIADARIAKGDLEGAIKPAREAARLAEHLGQINAIWNAARLLLNLSDWGGHARLMALAERMQSPEGPPEWNGHALDGTLVITERNNAHVGTAVRLARLIPLAAARAKRTIVLAQPRLIPLFRRSFAGVEVRELGVDDNATFAEATAVSGYHTLVQHLAADDEAIRAGFRPLLADADMVTEMRALYGDGPLIGISWHSTNTEKDLASLDEWAALLRATPATYVSLQYGDVANDVARLRELSGANVIHDEGVDSLRDLDTFAAQIMAMDAIVMISNTSAHMAGALGARAFVMVDEIRKTRLEWPLRGESVAWYPSVTLIRKGQHPWPEVFEHVRRRMQA